MSVVTSIQCDRCYKPINKLRCPDIIEGYAVVGNIHVVDPSHEKGIGGGIVGSNNWMKEPNMEPHVSHYCFHCMKDLLDMK